MAAKPNGSTGEPPSFTSSRGGQNNYQNVGLQAPVHPLILMLFGLVSITALVLGVLGFQAGNRAEASQAVAIEASVNAARAAERADQAERAAAISEINAKQIYVELNRLGYPVLTPAEPHPMEPIGDAE